VPDVLILYASNHGHTGKIAARIADVIERDGAVAHLRSAASADEVDPADYDAVVVGASIHAEKHQREVVDWARTHANALTRMPGAFFSVCLAAADENDKAREATAEYLDHFQLETGWTPRKRTTFAGALQYREYGFAMRLFMRLLMRKMHHPTDSSRDYDYTDWDAVEEFAHQCARMAVPTSTEAAR
jgi:menaquinone-dependent protoporphyrinogen oxidase